MSDKNSDSGQSDSRRQQLEKAVAMQYEENEEAPRVTAKGKGKLAEKIIELASQHEVPLYEDPDLVNLLYQLDLEEQIPASLYEVVAEVFAFLYRLNREQNGSEKDGG